MIIKSFIVPRSEKLKTFSPEDCQGLHIIDINLWFKNNGLDPDSMNEVRQYIFEEWLDKKINSSKSKIQSGFNIVILYESPTAPFISLLKEKIAEIFSCDFCDVVLVD